MPCKWAQGVFGQAIDFVSLSILNLFLIFQWVWMYMPFIVIEVDLVNHRFPFNGNLWRGHIKIMI